MDLLGVHLGFFFRYICRYFSHVFRSATLLVSVWLSRAGFRGQLGLRRVYYRHDGEASPSALFRVYRHTRSRVGSRVLSIFFRGIFGFLYAMSFLYGLRNVRGQAIRQHERTSVVCGGCSSNVQLLLYRYLYHRTKATRATTSQGVSGFFVFLRRN